MRSRWTKAHEDRALAEGWNVFLVQKDEFLGRTRPALEIQRHDEGCGFASDAQARGFVRLRALEGSDFHKMAMRITGMEK